jgi:putative transposase
MDATLKLKAEQLAQELASGAKTLDDVNDLVKTLMKSALERMLDTEMDAHLGRKAIVAAPTKEVNAGGPAPGNRRNGHSQKTISGEIGDLTLDTPRDRQGTFEPQLIGKHQRRLAGFDEKILALYAKGMTTRDIQEVVKDLYGVDVSPTLVSQITADLDGEVTAWRQRRLEPVFSAHDVCGDRCESPGQKRASGPVAERDGRRQVLAELPDRFEDAWPK